MKLTRSQKTSLCEALERLPAINDWETLKRIVDQLPFRMLIGRSDTPNAQLSSLIEQCAAITRGFDGLVDLLEPVDGGTKAFYEFLGILQKITCQAVSWAQILKLKSLLRELGSVDDSESARAYQIAAWFKPDLPDYCQEGDHLACYADCLAKFAHGRDSAPLFAYLELLRNHFGPLRSRIELWEKEVGHALNLNIRAIRRNVRDRAASVEGQIESNVLQIKLKPEVVPMVADYTHFIVQAWLVSGNASYSVELTTSRRLREEVPDIVCDAIIQARRKIRNLKNFRVEVILPLRDALEFDVASGDALSGDIREMVGSLWPIVVRPYERIYYEEDSRARFDLPHEIWVEKWRTKPDPLLESHIFWPCAADCPAHIYFGKLRADYLGVRAITLAPLNRNGEPFGSAHTTLLHIIAAGIPAALWLRECSDTPDNARDRLRILFPPEAFPDWPTKIRELHANAEGAISRATLLWDDPDLSPREFEYRLTGPSAA